MFVKLANEGAIAQYLADRFPEFAESGAIPQSVLVVSDDLFSRQGSCLERIESRARRALVAFAKSQAIDGHYSAQDDRIRCGIRVNGAGGIEVTWMQDGERVVSLVGVMAHSIHPREFGGSAPAEMADAKIASRLIAESAIFLRKAEIVRRERASLVRTCRTVGNVTATGKARAVKAWRVGGTDECRIHDQMTREIERCARSACNARHLAEEFAEVFW